MSRQPLAPDSDDFNVSVVSFGAGVRNKFHYHESDQILVVTEGTGRVVTEAGEEATVSAGDVVFAPAGERHWHGAVEASTFAHITVTRKGVADRAGGGVTELLRRERVVGEGNPVVLSLRGGRAQERHQFGELFSVVARVLA